MTASTQNGHTGAEFYVLVKATRDDVGRQNGCEFMQARKSKPEPGLFRNLGLDQRWIKVNASVPAALLMGIQTKDQIGTSAAPVTTPSIELK